MDYFLITQDARISNRVEPIISKSMQEVENWDESDSISLGIKEKNQVEYVDFIEHPFPLVSDELKQLLTIYQPDTVFVPVVLNDRQHSLQRVYWRLNLPKLVCLSEKTEFHKNTAIKRLVLKQIQVWGWHFFQVDQVREPLIVFNLMVVESMLRRGLTGFKLDRIEVDPG